MQSTPLRVRKILAFLKFAYRLEVLLDLSEAARLMGNPLGRTQLTCKTNYEMPGVVRQRMRVVDAQ
jgi:hypothetical protein